MPHYSPTPAQVDAWNNPASLGFSTWKRHATTGAVARTPLVQKKQHALEAVYQRNASFTAGLIARQANRTGFDSGNTNFVFRLNRFAVSKYGNDHVWNTSNNLKPVGHGASDDVTPNKTGQHQSNTPRLPSMPDGADRNNSPMRRGITMSGGYSSPDSTIPNSTIARSTSRNSKRSLDAGEAGTSERDGLNLRRVLVHKNDMADSPAIKPSENIARSTAFSEVKIPASSPLAEAHDYSRSNTNVTHEADHTHSFAVSETESASYKPIFYPGNGLPRSLVRRSPVSLHQSSTDLSTSQRLPLRISPIPIMRLLRTSHASLATGVPARSEWLPINHRTLFKTANRQTSGEGGAEAGFALPENSGYDRIGKSTTRLTPHSIARSSETEIRRTSLGPVLNPPRKSSSVINATPGTAEPYADSITPDFQGSPKAVDVNSSVLSIERLIQPDPIYKSALPQRSKENFHRTPLQPQIRNGLPIHRTHALQRLSQVTAPDTHASPFRAHQYDNLLPLRKIIAQRSSSVASAYFASTPEATGSAPHGGQSVTSTHIGHIPFNNTMTHPTGGIGGAQRAMQRSQRSLDAVTAPHTGISSRLSRLAFPLPPVAITGGSYLSLKQEHRFNNPLASRPAGAQSAHSLANLGMPPAIIRTISGINRSIGHADRSLSSAAPPLMIHGLESFGAEYAPVPGVATNPRASSTRDTAGTDTAPTAATASGSDPASHVIKRFTQNITGTPPMLRRLEKNLNPRFLPLSRASVGQTGPWTLTRRPMTASNATASFIADTNLADSQQAARAFQGDSGTFNKSTPGAAARPLAMVQRMPAQLIRMSGERTSDEPYHDFPEDRYGVVPAPYQVSRQVSDALPDKVGKASSKTVSPSGEPDSDEIAEHAWRSMMERLIIEQERRGLAKWP